MILGAFSALTLAAALIVLQGQLNGALQMRIGLIGTIFWTHFVVTIIIFPFVVYYYSDIADNVSGKLLKDNSYTLLIAGLFGVVIVPALAFAIPVIGLKNAFFCLVIMQVLFSVVLEYLGQGIGLGLRDVAGIILLAAAGWLIIYR